MVKTNSVYFSYAEVFASKLPFYMLIDKYFDRSRKYKVELKHWPGAEAYKVTQEVSE